MRTAVCHLESTSPYSQSKPFEADRREDESPDERETRTWRDKCHATPDGHLFIPPMAFTWAIQFSAKRMGRPIPNSRGKTYTKMFEGGIICMDPIVLPDTKDRVTCERVYVNADGVRGSGKRVFKNFPMVPEWSGKLIVQLLNDAIPTELFEETLTYAGKFCGIGRFRPERGGYLGRFIVKKIHWSNGA